MIGWDKEEMTIEFEISTLIPAPAEQVYDAWLDCLVEAARRHDPQFTPDVEEAWRQTLSIGIEDMRSKY